MHTELYGMVEISCSPQLSPLLRNRHYLKARSKALEAANEIEANRRTLYAFPRSHRCVLHMALASRMRMGWKRIKPACASLEGLSQVGCQHIQPVALQLRTERRHSTRR